jgi:membrane-associated protease RseP (regulator of RpoE activity)
VTTTEPTPVAVEPGTGAGEEPARYPWLAIPILVGAVWLGSKSVPALLMALSIIVAIFLHELAHYMTARWTGMKVTEFFLGFGPRIWSFRRGETEFGVKAIPAGGYARIIGMNNLDEVAPADAARAYSSKSYPRKLLVVSAGSLMHMLIALVALGSMLAFVGTESYDEWRVDAVAAGSPADEAGLEPGERIVAIDGVAVQSWLDVRDIIATHPGQELELTLSDGSSERSVDVVPQREVVNGEVIGRLGVAAEFPAQSVGVTELVPRTLGEMGTLLEGSLVGMKDFVMNFGDFTGNLVSDDPSNNRPVSVVGLVEVGGDVGRDSAANLLFLIAAFNVFVGVFNYLPLLPLDGGHAAVATYERIRSRRGQRYEVDMARLLPVTYAVVMFLVFLGLASLYLDIRFGIDVGS